MGKISLMYQPLYPMNNLEPIFHLISNLIQMKMENLNLEDYLKWPNCQLLLAIMAFNQPEIGSLITMARILTMEKLASVTRKSTSNKVKS